MRKIIDGNGACSEMAYLFSELACIYPITPSSPMASNIDHMSVKGRLNFWHDKVRVIEMQSEAGAVGALHGALLSGSLATTFTASQGLLLMIPNMYKIAGEGLPGVIHVASRTVATHALSIFGDHSDVYAVRQTGFCILCSNNVADAYYLAAVAHLSAIKGGLPFLHFFDGFRTSHELNVIDTLDEKDLISLIDMDKLQAFKNRSINVGSCLQYGMAENEDIYFQSLEARNPLYNEMPDVVSYYMEQINRLAKTHYAPFEYYGCADATCVIIAMGSVCDTIRLVIDEEMKKNRKLGMISVRLYRPFSALYLKKVLPASVRKIAVLDRSKEAGSSGEPLYLDVLSALSDEDIKIVGGRYGISSKDTTPQDILAVYDMLDGTLKNSFTIGIVDDITHLSLPTREYSINLSLLEIKIYGFGSDGMVSASKDLLKIIGKDKYVQGYFEYDSKKSGGVTISHLRIGNKPILAPYYGNNTDITVVTKDEYFHKYHLLDGVKENSLLLINTNDEKGCFAKMTKYDYEIIKQKHLKVLMIDADKIALDCHIKGKISKIIEIILLELLGISNAYEILAERIALDYAVKGKDVVINNQKAIAKALKNVKNHFYSLDVSYDINFKSLSVFEAIHHRMGGQLSTSQVKDVCNGAFPYAMSKLEKRAVSSLVAKWDFANCIQCGMCSIVCPHAVIRPFLLTNDKGIEAVQAKGQHFYIGISEADCTSCGLCVQVCPGKNGKKALTLGKYDNKQADFVNHLFNHYENPKLFSKFTVKGSQLEKPRFEFSGACAGCGETSYIKLLTQLFQDEIIIANATGCSSIYGGSAPYTPYSIPWANSLFEDNAEFAYGMHCSYQTKRERLKQLLTTADESETIKELAKTILENFDNNDIVLDAVKKLALEPISQELRELLNYASFRVVWAIGGDGWAYDIGFGGIDHILASNENVKILVLDTEVYSNTGGQMSKSSHIGQVAEFADLGKKNEKKDLFKIAMCYPNCYVASVSLGANMMQTIKAFKEAQEHQGPSIIIAYCPCVEHGINGGLSCTTKEQKLAVDVGYLLLMRYYPEQDLLKLDSKEPDFTRYSEFLDNEVRYHSLKLKDKKLAKILLDKNLEDAKKRYIYYQKKALEKND